MEELVTKKLSTNRNLEESIGINNTRIHALERQNAELKGDIEYKEVEKHEVSKERQQLEKQFRYVWHTAYLKHFIQRKRYQYQICDPPAQNQAKVTFLITE
jgi:hypothetical protein